VDVFNNETLTPVSGNPMQIHMMRDDPNYKPTRISTLRKVPLHFKKEADKTLHWFIKSGVIVPVPPTEREEWGSPGFFVAKPNGKCRLVEIFISDTIRCRRLLLLFIRHKIQLFYGS
jgi:hypothetical protein